MIRSVLLEPLPYPDPARLVTLQNTLSVPELSDLKAATRSFTAMGGATPLSLDLTGGPEPVKVRAALSAGDLFEALGARAALGRPLTREDDRQGGDAVVALSHQLWQRQWAGDSAIVGKSITLGGLPYTVVGVLAPSSGCRKSRRTSSRPSGSSTRSRRKPAARTFSRPRFAGRRE